MTYTAVHLYARFSKLEQKEGMSIERQLGDMRRLCQHCGWVPDEVLIDEGRSAFHGHNRTGQGKLGLFEAEAQAGEHVGALLIVERLDRLSRGGHHDTYTLITTLTANGVSIATVDGSEVYQAYVSLDLVQVITLLVKAQLAHEESVKKSERSRANWAIRYQRAARDGMALGRNCPPWLEIVDGRYRIIPARGGRPDLGSLVARIFAMADASEGSSTMALSEQRGSQDGAVVARRMSRKSRAKPPSPFLRFNSSPEVIRLVVMMYVRFPLSLRNVEDLLFERGIDICHETVRHWWNRFGPIFGSEARRQRVSRMRGFRHWRWHLDEMYVKLNGEMVYLWRAVDQEGEILESYITRSRDKAAALTFMKKTLKRHGSPEAITTDGLRSYGAAMYELGNGQKREVGRWANNRVENSHLPFRRRERAMLRFRRMKTLQKFASVHANVHNHFNLERHLVDRQTFKQRRSAAQAEWQSLAS